MTVCTICGHPPHACVESPTQKLHTPREEEAMRAVVALHAIVKAAFKALGEEGWSEEECMELAHDAADGLGLEPKPLPVLNGRRS